MGCVVPVVVHLRDTLLFDYYIVRAVGDVPFGFFEATEAHRAIHNATCNKDQDAAWLDLPGWSRTRTSLYTFAAAAGPGVHSPSSGPLSSLSASYLLLRQAFSVSRRFELIELTGAQGLASRRTYSHVHIASLQELLCVLQGRCRRRVG